MVRHFPRKNIVPEFQFLLLNNKTHNAQCFWKVWLVVKVFNLISISPLLAMLKMCKHVWYTNIPEKFIQLQSFYWFTLLNVNDKSKECYALSAFDSQRLKILIFRQCNDCFKVIYQNFILASVVNIQRYTNNFWGLGSPWFSWHYIVIMKTGKDKIKGSVEKVRLWGRYSSLPSCWLAIDHTYSHIAVAKLNTFFKLLFGIY